ncbi:MAG: R3H domain-containing nucleic acid-binding protein [bacterium]
MNDAEKETKKTSYSPRETLEMMLGHLGFVFEITEEQRVTGPALHIHMRNPARLIGRDGKTLDELQYLFNRLLPLREQETPHVVLDVEGYRLHQQSELIKHVKHCMKEAHQTGKPVHLPPLNSFDRRIVHMTCQEDAELETISPNEPARLKSVTIQLKKKQESAPDKG